MNRQKLTQLAVVLIILSVLIIGATQRFDTIIAKKIVITGSGGFELGDNSGSFDLNGKELTLDANDDSSITCDTNDQCDWELGGQDEYVFTAAVFDIGEGTLTRIDLDAAGITSIRSSAEAQIDLELGGSDQVIFRAAAAADSATTNEYTEIALTSPVDTTGSNTHNALTVDLAIGDATGGTNAVRGLQIDSITGDAEVTETAINVASGWDVGLAVDAPVDFTYVQGIDAGAAGDSLEVAFTSPIDTSGTNTHNALTVDLAVGNSTAGTNNVRGIQIDAITDDPQVVETAINIGDEWDVAIDTNLPIVATAVTWMDDFLGDEVLGQYTEINGADGQAVQAIKEEQFGAYAITSGDVGDTDANDLEAMYLSLEWQADQGALIFETRLHLDTDVTTTQLCAGFTDDVSTAEVAFTIGGSDVVTAVAEDAVMFCFDTRADTDEWFALGVANTTKGTGNGATGTAPAANTYQVLRIEIDDGGADCRFYIDGTLAATITANCVTVTDLLAPGFVISSAATADSNTVDIDYMFVAAARD